MRNATILVLRLKGIATEAIKNIVLAGIGKLLVVDTENVSEEDLGAGFFFRDEDVGQKVRWSPVRCFARPGFGIGGTASGTLHHGAVCQSHDGDQTTGTGACTMTHLMLAQLSIVVASESPNGWMCRPRSDDYFDRPSGE